MTAVLFSNSDKVVEILTGIDKLCKTVGFAYQTFTQQDPHASFKHFEIVLKENAMTMKT